MNRATPKPDRLRLGSSEYSQLRAEVLKRDGWRCQFCGSRTQLEVHHQEFRSHSGEDTERNLITLCLGCHRSIHRAFGSSETT